MRIRPYHSIALLTLLLFFFSVQLQAQQGPIKRVGSPATSVLRQAALLDQRAVRRTAFLTAQSKVSKGEIDSSIVYYDRALKSSSSDDEWVESCVALSALLYQTAQQGQKQGRYLDTAQYLLSRLTTRASGATRIEAYNNLGILLFQKGDTLGAVQAFEHIRPLLDSTNLDKKWRARYYHNYGNILTRLNNLSGALDLHSQAVRLDPTDKNALLSLKNSALASRSESKGIPAAVELVETALQGQEYEIAAQTLDSALVAPYWPQNSYYPELIIMLAKYFTVANVSPQQYRERWQPRLLQVLSANYPNASINTMLRQIDRLYSDTTASEIPRLDFLGGRYEYQEWVHNEDDRKIISDFLKMVGDSYFHSRNYRKALSCYTRAWNVDEQNAVAGVYLVNLLLEHPQDIDPSGEILRNLVEELFYGKGQMYLQEIKNWEDIARFHVLLGIIFERQEQYGPEKEPRSALFQWNRAIEALNKAKKTEMILSVPDLYGRMGKGYAAVNEGDKSWHAYVNGAEAAVRAKRYEDGSHLLEMARSLEYRPTPSEEGALETLNAQLLEALEKEREFKR